MEYLSKLIENASAKPGFKFHPYYIKLKLVNLIFTDDLIMFSATNPFNVQCILKAFYTFSGYTGLTTNKAKS